MEWIKICGTNYFSFFNIFKIFANIYLLIQRWHKPRRTLWIIRGVNPHLYASYYHGHFHFRFDPDRKEKGMFSCKPLVLYMSEEVRSKHQHLPVEICHLGISLDCWGMQEFMHACSIQYLYWNKLLDKITWKEKDSTRSSAQRNFSVPRPLQKYWNNKTGFSRETQASIMRFM